MLALLLAAGAFAQGNLPQVWYVYPAGRQQGTEVEVLVRGRWLTEATEVRVSGEGVTGAILSAETKMPDKKDKRLDASDFNDYATVKLSITADAAPGQRDLRMISPGGVSNRFRFYVDPLPDVVEVELTADANEAQPIGELPVVVNGQIFQADADSFRFHAEAGQTLVFETLAQAIVPFIADAVPGWFQPTLAIFDEQGKEIAFCDDFRHQPDPVIIHTFEKAGDYRVELKDALYRGRDDFVYRLRIGELPYISHVFPLGGKAGEETTFELAGANLPQHKLSVKLPDDGSEISTVGVNRGPLVSNNQAVAVDRHAEFLETEPNDLRGQANTVATPVTINARIGRTGDIDRFDFTARKGQRLIFQTHARRLGSPVDTVITVYDANRKRLVGNDDWEDPKAGLVTHHADSQCSHTFEADGEYQVEVADVRGHGGDAFAYRLTIAPPQPDFRLRLRPDAVRAPQGGGALVTLTAFRREGFRDAISLQFADLPPGVTAPAAVIPEAADQTVLSVPVSEEAATGVYFPHLTGAAEIAGQTVTRVAQPSEELMQAFYYMHSAPSQEFLLAVVEAGPFSVELTLPEGGVVQVPRRGSVDVPARVKRKEGVNGAISFRPDSPPKGIAVRAKPVPPEADTTTITITTRGQQVNVGQTGVLVLSGELRQGKTTSSGFVPGIPYEIVRN